MTTSYPGEPFPSSVRSSCSWDVTQLTTLFSKCRTHCELFHALCGRGRKPLEWKGILTPTSALVGVPTSWNEIELGQTVLTSG